MEWQGWFALGLCVAVLATLIFTRIGPHLVMIGALTILSATGILSTPMEQCAQIVNHLVYLYFASIFLTTSTRTGK